MTLRQVWPRALGGLCLLLLGVQVARASEFPGAEEATLHRSYTVLEAGPAETVSRLTAPQRDELARFLLANPVTAFDALSKYDPDTSIGFCFGRSLAVYLKARGFGLQRLAIRKVITVGELDYGGPTQWRFHIATIVPGTDGEWYAIDPWAAEFYLKDRAKGVMTVSDWFRAARRASRGKNPMRLYVVPPEVVMPDIAKAALEENGSTHVVDLAFDPVRNEGFSSESLGGEDVYRPSGSALTRHFLAVPRRAEQPGFRFLGLAVPWQKEPLDFRGYFRDLLATLSRK